MRRHGHALALGIAVAAAAAAAGERAPWPRRIGREVDCYHLTAHKGTPVDLWPEEPPSPDPVDRGGFAAALGDLCGRMPQQRRDRYADAILAEAERFGVDPFLMAALVLDQSRCWPRTPTRDRERGRFGLTRIPLAMHAPHARGGSYRYWVREGEAWSERSLSIDAHPFNEWKAAQVEPNLYFAAAILRVLEEQGDSLDEAFPGAPYRHPVSHWFYGDRVREAEPENRVLTARRRMISYYSGAGTSAAGEFMGSPIVSPLDGAPRLVIDYFGNPRGNPRGPGHRGIDIDGVTGEPVRAVAAGRVVFAGVDLAGPGEHELLDPEEAAERARSEMGPGGLYVALNHGNDFGTFYMHLDSLAVSWGEEVAAGQAIGTLGRTGTKRSMPHLHLEFRVGTDRVDPAVPLAAVLVDPYRDR